MDFIPPGHVEPVLNRPPMDSTLILAQVDKTKKSIGGSWKRIVRMPMSPKSPSRRSPITHRSKRAHQLLSDLEFEKDPKKNKSAADIVPSDTMKTLAVVALQPRRTP